MVKSVLLFTPIMGPGFQPLTADISNVMSSGTTGTLHHHPTEDTLPFPFQTFLRDLSLLSPWRNSFTLNSELGERSQIGLKSHSRTPLPPSNHMRTSFLDFPWRKLRDTGLCPFLAKLGEQRWPQNRWQEPQPTSVGGKRGQKFRVRWHGTRDQWVLLLFPFCPLSLGWSVTAGVCFQHHSLNL
jgi:hypothetical protein